MKHWAFLIFLCTGPLFSLNAQPTDPELAEKLKAVMLLFEKNQQSLKARIEELKSTNLALTESNLKLFRELQSVHERVHTLESENMLLRSQLSQVAVNEMEAASLQPSPNTDSSWEFGRDAKRTTPSSLGNPPFVASASSPGDQNRTMNRPRQLQTVPPELININTASEEELTTIPLIDRNMAEQIISNRPYSTVEDLIVNRGFGPMKLRRVSPYVTVE